MTRLPPTPPRPDLVRRPRCAFGWLEAQLLHDRWLARMEPDAIAVLLLLALAADRRGASYFGRLRMAEALGMDVERVDRALDRLLRLQLVALRPWRPGIRDGVWQLLPVEQHEFPRSGTTMSVGELLRSLGVTPDADPRATGEI